MSSPLWRSSAAAFGAALYVDGFAVRGETVRVLEMVAHVASISRGKGRTATSAAAYRACAVIDCEREGRTHDYRRKGGLEASAIFAPTGAPAWAFDRSKLWNGAELRERNKDRRAKTQDKANAVTAREVMFAFPAELSAAGRLAVAEAVARHLVDKHGVAADFSIHAPGKDGDQRNHHCHLMFTTRRMTAKGLGEKTREWDGKYDRSRTTKAFRVFLAETMNAAIAAEGKADLVFVEHRSFEERGVPIKPTRHQGPGKTHAARKQQKTARDGWHRRERKEQSERQAKERAGLKTRQDFGLAALTGDLAERERRGVAAIRAELAQAQAADIAPKGASRLFQVVTGQAMRGDFDRQGRAAQRGEASERQIAELKTSLRAEASAYVADQAKEGRALADRHRGENQHLEKSLSARIEFDRAAEAQARRDEVQRSPVLARERSQARDFDRGLSP